MPTTMWAQRSIRFSQSARKTSIARSFRASRRVWQRAGRSRYQDGRAYGLARFKIDMRLGGILQRIGLLDRNLHRALGHDVHEVFRHADHVLALGAVVHERRPR